MAYYPSWQGKQAVIPFEDGEVFFDGIFTEPQLNHPECLVFDEYGNIWCGGEKGEIYRIASDGSRIEEMASTKGFTLGLAFDQAGILYTCDLKHSAVFRFNPHNGELLPFAEGDGQGRKIRVPNVPVVDQARGVLYVSDSYDPYEAGPGIWRFDLATGKGQLWYNKPLRFANGLVLTAAGDALFVAETFARQISRIPILPDGSAGEKTVVANIDALPDGLTLDAEGNLYICCYEPSLIYRWREDTGVELLFYDPEAHLLCHPTNGVVRGQELFVSNLGRWHITRIRLTNEVNKD
ncbi:hypothetical protein A8709_15150 [Paenibacillus pectinilyticus]|uniref:SMP-30/Gluconolactonase/LRE-like region domain-containing protein n=1 Tax=Paenibacillus pectinilyticus TaxID=512399 RepID=A0A1C1A4D5_9BACL|nr:SMP-30/gluconolactonase/LRE family protein [Paenibacillus pectinilyticus]OCT15415.1 hypothetical protein A8709_15150 [Paenibacillus pectinilyticus]